MAKNRRIANSDSFEVRNEMKNYQKELALVKIESDYEKNRFINDQINKMKTFLKVHGKENTELSGVATCSLSPVITKKRTDAAKKYEKRGLKLVNKYLNYDPGKYSSAMSQWLSVCMGYLPIGYNRASYSSGTYIATAIWILDQIDSGGNMDKLVDLLESNAKQLEYDFVSEIPPMMSRHASSLVVAVSNIVARRNADCKKISPRMMYEENILNDIIAKEEHAKPNFSHDLFEKVVALIPEKSITRALAHTEAQIWRIMEAVISSYSFLEEKLVQEKAAIDANITSFLNKSDTLDKTKEKLLSEISMLPQQPQSLPSLLPPLSVPRRMAFAGGDVTISNLHEERLSFLESKNKIYAIEQIKMRMPSNMLHISFYPEGHTVTVSSPDLLEKEASYVKSSLNEENFRCLDVKNPGETLFSLIYLLDKGDLLAYLTPAVPLLLHSTYFQIPFEFKKQKKYFKRKKTSETPQFFNDLVHNTRFGFSDPDTTLCSLNKIMWNLCGAIPPNNINTYMNQYSKLNDFGIPEDYKTVLAYSSALINEIRASEKKNERLPDSISNLVTDDFGDDDFEEDSAENTTERSVHAQDNAALRRKNKNLIAELNKEKDLRSDLENTISELQDEVNRLKEENELLALSREISDAAEEDTEIEFPYKLKNKIAIFGCYDKWASFMKDYLDGDVIYDTLQSNHITKEYITNADIICIYIRGIGHSSYYSIVDQAKYYGKQVLYLNHKNHKLNAKEIILIDKAYRNTDR